MNMIFDVHAHYDDEKFDADREEVICSLKSNGVCGVINAGTNLETSQKSLELAEKYPYFFAAVGIHPEDCSELPNDYVESLKKMLNNKKAVAIGEIGLDYYWKEIDRETQFKVFEEQLILANTLDKPVIIHDREAHGDTMKLLYKHKPKGLLHCFSGSVELSREVIKLGMYISLGGAVTFKNARHSVEVARDIPLERLLLETDAPYMSPVPFRGKRCDSTMIRFTAEKIAQIREIDTETLLNATRKNAEGLFNIKL